jgi:hypothetical protein
MSQVTMHALKKRITYSLYFWMCFSAMPSHEPLDTRKLRNMLEEAMKKRSAAATTASLIQQATSSSSSSGAADLFADPTKFVVLVLSGAFNPVHNM